MNKTKKSHPTRVFIPRFQYLPILRWLRLIRSIGRLVFWDGGSIRKIPRRSIGVVELLRTPCSHIAAPVFRQRDSCVFARAASFLRRVRKDVARGRTDFLPEWSNSEIGQIGLPVERRNDRTDYIIVYSVTDILENFPLFPLFLPNSETENVGHVGRHVSIVVERFVSRCIEFL